MAQYTVEIQETKATIEVSEVPATVAITQTATVLEIANAGIQGPQGETDLSAINSHIDNIAPHPAYDDIPSLTLLFENRIA